MGVFLKSLTVKNYLFFSGCTNIDLDVSSTKDRNLIVIGGVNGAGKTTLLKAIKYTIAGLTSDKAARLYSSENPSDDEMLFQLSFSWKGEAYHLTRKYDKQGQFFRNSSLEHDLGIEREEKQIQETIDTIFPPSLLDLFFFDVEDVRSILTRDSAGEDIKTQIERLLGIELLRQARDDARLLARENDTSQEDTSVSIPRLEAEVSEKEEREEEIHQSLQIAQDNAQKLEQQLSQMPSSSSARRLEERLNEKEREIDSSGERINRLRDDSLSHIKTYLAYELLWPLISQFAAEDETRTERQQLFDETQVLETLRNKENELARLGLTLTQAESVIRLLSARYEDETPTLRTSYKTVNIKLQTVDMKKTTRDLQTSLEEEVNRRERLKQEKEGLKKQKNRFQDDDSEREFKQNYLRDTKEKIERLVESKTQLAQEKAALQKKLAEARERTTEHKRKRSRETVAEDFVNIFSKMLDIGRKKLITKLGQEATVIFRKIDNDPDLYGSINFDPGYRPYLLRNGERWEASNLSEGHQAIFAYSILGALMKLSGHSLPAVIDTPMMKLDSTHKTNVIEHLYPTLSHQVVLFSSEEEIDAKYYPKLKPFVAKSYLIEKEHVTSNNGISKSSYVTPGYFNFEDLP